MDPLSFTASLMTVSGVTIMTSKLIYTLRERVKNAPKDVGDLLEQLQTFQELLEELQKQLQDSGDNAAAQSKLPQIWGKSVAHMRRDVESLRTKLSKLEQLLKKKSLGSKVLISARQMLSEKDVAKYQSKIDKHCGVLTCIKATICDQNISKLTQNTIQLGNDNNAGFQMISSQVSQATGHLEAEARAGFSSVFSDLRSAKLASDEMHREQMRSIEINEAGFQAVQSALVTAASFNREGHESTHAMLRQQETLMQQLGNYLALGGSKNCVRSPRSRSDKMGSNTSKTTSYWKVLHHSLPIGQLRITIKQTRHRNGSEDSASPDSTESNIKVTFVPPKWLTCLAAGYRMKLGYSSIGDQWHWGANLRPLTVNQNPFVIDALETCDLGAIQKSFREGLIQSTDYILLWGDVYPWYLSLDLREPNGSHYNSLSILVYMAENGLPGQDCLLFKILSCLERKRSPTLAEDILQTHVRIYLQHGGNLFTGRHFQGFFLRDLLLHCGPSTANLVSESLFHSSESLTVDEFSSFSVCFLGTVAQVNSGFRTRLKEYLASCRSPSLAAGTIYADNLLDSTFGMASVLRNFHGMDNWTSRRFLAGLCRTGTPSMVRPFIDTGIDLNDDECYDNMLGNAAEVGNLDVVRMLIESGANSALALYYLIRGAEELSEELSDGLFTHLLELLVENSRPTSFTRMYYDALAVVIRSPRALLAHPEAPEILIRRKVFSDELINCSCGQDYRCNYMCVAITRRLGSVAELLLQHGAYASTKSAWLICSVQHGATSCTEALIQHGADVNFLDGAGRSALQLARSNATAPHPRISTLTECCHHLWCEVTAEEDAENLAAVERAFHLKAQSTNNLKACEPSCTLEPRFLKQNGEAVPAPAPQNTFEKAFGSLLTYYRRPPLGWHSRCLSYEIGDLWSLSFYEALLMRFFYVLSYVILLALGVLAFIRGDKCIRMPSRSILSAVALLLLAFIWGTSPQTNLFSMPDTVRSVTKQDS